MVVIDEVAGQSLTFTLVGNYLQGNWNFWYAYLIGFALFRLFDIVKMGPVKWADRQTEKRLGRDVGRYVCRVFCRSGSAGGYNQDIRLCV